MSFLDACVFFCTQHLTRDAFRTIQRNAQTAGNGFVVVPVSLDKPWGSQPGQMQEVTVNAVSGAKKDDFARHVEMTDPMRHTFDDQMRAYDRDTQLVWVFLTCGVPPPGESHQVAFLITSAPSPSNVTGSLKRS